MADKVELLHLPRSGDSSIVLSETRSILAARGRKHAASIMACKPVPKLFAGAMSGGKSDLDKQGDADEQFHLGERYYRSEEHTSEPQSRQYLVCRLLLEKHKNGSIHRRSPPKKFLPHERAPRAPTS